MWCKEDSGGRCVEVADEGDKVWREAEEDEGAGEEAVVLGWEGALEVDVVYVGVSFGAVGVFDDKLEEHGGSCARASFSEPLRRWAQDFVCFRQRWRLCKRLCWSRACI